MKNYIAEETYEVQGRGIEVPVKPEDCPELGERVRVNGEEVTVIGIETRFRAFMYK